MILVVRGCLTPKKMENMEGIATGANDVMRNHMAKVQRVKGVSGNTEKVKLLRSVHQKRVWRNHIVKLPTDHPIRTPPRSQFEPSAAMFCQSIVKPQRDDEK